MPQFKPLTWLAILLVLNVLLLSLQVRNAEGQVLLRVWGQFVFSPVASVIEVGSSGFMGALRRYQYLLDAEHENARLKRENARLQIELNRLQGLVGLLPRTRDYEPLRRSFEWEVLPASIIARSAPFLSNRVVINRGTSSGIGRDSAVFVADGVVGRVTVCSPFSAEVELIVNDRAAVGALLEETRIQGIVQGTGSSLLELNYIPNSQLVKVGERVLTSGTDQVYPKGLPIGRVLAAQAGSVIYQDISVEPFVDFQKVEEVLVEVKSRRRPDAETEDQKDSPLPGPEEPGGSL